MGEILQHLEEAGLGSAERGNPKKSRIRLIAAFVIAMVAQTFQGCVGEISFRDDDKDVKGGKADIISLLDRIDAGQRDVKLKWDTAAEDGDSGMEVEPKDISGGTDGDANLYKEIGDITEKDSDIAEGGDLQTIDGDGDGTNAADQEETPNDEGAAAPDDRGQTSVDGEETDTIPSPGDTEPGREAGSDAETTDLNVGQELPQGEDVPEIPADKPITPDTPVLPDGTLPDIDNTTLPDHSQPTPEEGPDGSYAQYCEWVKTVGYEECWIGKVTGGEILTPDCYNNENDDCDGATDEYFKCNPWGMGPDCTTVTEICDGVDQDNDGTNDEYVCVDCRGVGLEWEYCGTDEGICVPGIRECTINSFPKVWLHCAGSIEPDPNGEDCTNEMDDDCDGQIDCNDQACIDAPECQK